MFISVVGRRQRSFLHHHHHDSQDITRHILHPHHRQALSLAPRLRYRWNQYHLIGNCLLLHVFQMWTQSGEVCNEPNHEQLRVTGA
jgi:hypothetical protein